MAVNRRSKTRRRIRVHRKHYGVNTINQAIDLLTEYGEVELTEVRSQLRSFVSNDKLWDSFKELQKIEETRKSKSEQVEKLLIMSKRKTKEKEGR